jgi:3-phenylpropionate/cinnamic acid dioxygenase small subunit
VTTTSHRGISTETQLEIERFLYDEAATLDERRYHDWLNLLTEDIHYWAPLKRTVLLKDADEFEIGKPGEQAYFDDDIDMLRQRIAKLDTGYSWSEDPPSRTRHMVNNVRVLKARGDGEGQEVDLDVYFFCYRSRLDNDIDIWVGNRRDTLRRVDGDWKISKRHIFLDQVVLNSKNLSSFL